MPFQPGTPKPARSGRRPGSKNKRTLIAEEWAQSFLKNGPVQTALEQVLCDPTHEHWRWAVELMHSYAYGKPIKRSETKSDIDQRQVTQIVDYREFFQQTQANGHTNGVAHASENGETA